MNLLTYYIFITKPDNYVRGINKSTQGCLMVHRPTSNNDTAKKVWNIAVILENCEETPVHPKPLVFPRDFNDDIVILPQKISDKYRKEFLEYFFQLINY